MKNHIKIMTITILISGCAQTGETADTPFLNTTWNLTEMYGETVHSSGSQVPHLRFEAERVTGNDGCNNFFGPYRLSDDMLGFGLLASTRMACPQIESFDIAFNKMLLKTTLYRITGDTLELFAGDKLLASFAAAEQN